jgi:competence protein ComGC
MGTLIVLAILILIVALIIANMIKDKKKGKSLQCGGDCSRCHGHCPHS